MILHLLHLRPRAEDVGVLIPQAHLIATVWAGTAVASFFTILRSWLQYSHNKRLFTNDALICLALLSHIILSIIVQLLAPLFFESSNATEYFTVLKALPLATFEKFLKYQFAALHLIWTALWMVKLATLSFFWRLFASVRTDVRLFWWIMFGITIATWAISLFLLGFSCSPPSEAFTTSIFLSPSCINGFHTAFVFSSITDIVTDFMIMLIPLPLLHHLHIPRRQKGILLVIFLTPLIAIGFAISRLTVQSIGSLGLILNPIQLALYSTLEVSVSIIAACLPSLRLYFTDPPKSSAASRVPHPKMDAQLPMLQSMARQYANKSNPSALKTGSREAILDPLGNQV